GVTSASLTVTMPATAGSYVLKLFANGGYTLVVASPTITVQGSTLPPTMTVTPTTVAGGGTVAVALANAPGNADDWVALIPAAGPDSAFVDWQYLNGQKTLPASGLTTAALT